MEKYNFILSDLMVKLCANIGNKLKENNGVNDTTFDCIVDLSSINSYKELSAIEKNELYIHLDTKLGSMLLEASNDSARLVYRLTINNMYSDIINITVTSVDLEVLENAMKDNNLLGITDVN